MILYSLMMIRLFNEDFNKFTFFANEMDIFSVDLDKTNLDDDKSFDKYNPEITINVRLLVWVINLKNEKRLKRYKRRINASNVAFYKMRKMNRTNFYR